MTLEVENVGEGGLVGPKQQQLVAATDESRRQDLQKEIQTNERHIKNLQRLSTRHPSQQSGDVRSGRRLWSRPEGVPTRKG